MQTYADRWRCLMPFPKALMGESIYQGGAGEEMGSWTASVTFLPVPAFSFPFLCSSGGCWGRGFWLTGLFLFRGGLRPAAGCHLPVRSPGPRSVEDEEAPRRRRRRRWRLKRPGVRAGNGRKVQREQQRGPGQRRAAGAGGCAQRPVTDRPGSV